MSESETAKALTRLIKRADKIFQDAKRSAEAAKKLLEDVKKFKG